MPTQRGKAEVMRFMEQLPQRIIPVLRGAVRAGGTVIADEAKERSVSKEVADAVVLKTKKIADRVSVSITVALGWARSLAIWQEYGTAGHFITVDDSQRAGRSVTRINLLNRDAEKTGGSLVIGGKFVGTTVYHPGAQAHPFLRVALDVKESEAFAAARSYLYSRVTPRGVLLASDDGDEA